MTTISFYGTKALLLYLEYTATNSLYSALPSPLSLSHQWTCSVVCIVTMIVNMQSHQVNYH